MGTRVRGARLFLWRWVKASPGGFGVGSELCEGQRRWSPGALLPASLAVALATGVLPPLIGSEGFNPLEPGLPFRVGSAMR